MSNERLRASLEAIRDMEGDVCDEYGVCQHLACASSYNSWAFADHALTHTESVTDCILCVIVDGRIALAARQPTSELGGE